MSSIGLPFPALPCCGCSLLPPGAAPGWPPVEAGCFRMALCPAIDAALRRGDVKERGRADSSRKSREEEVTPGTGTALAESSCAAKPCSEPPKLGPHKSFPSFKSRGREPSGSTPQNGRPPS